MLQWKRLALTGRHLPAHTLKAPLQRRVLSAALRGLGQHRRGSALAASARSPSRMQREHFRVTTSTRPGLHTFTGSETRRLGGGGGAGSEGRACVRQRRQAGEPNQSEQADHSGWPAAGPGGFASPTPAAGRRPLTRPGLAPDDSSLRLGSGLEGPPRFRAAGRRYCRLGTRAFLVARRASY